MKNESTKLSTVFKPIEKDENSSIEVFKPEMKIENQFAGFCACWCEQPQPSAQAHWYGGKQPRG